MDSDLKLVLTAIVFIAILVIFYLVDKYTSEPSKNKNNKVNESVKKGSTASEEWINHGGDMTEMMKEMAEESGATDMSEKEKDEINKKEFGKLTKTTNKR